ncbi:MAG: hypothetical protein IKO19_11235 [Candidatus Riflebacteria bacterium]|nr:hypothetical protein [Candidatus Riflebacteria bacterium]
MSVLRRPPRELLMLFVAVLCLVATFTLYAQSEEVPVSTSEPVVTNNEPVVPAEPSAVEKAADNQPVTVTDVKDAVKTSLEVIETSISPAIQEQGKAISIEVSPADEVPVDNSVPAVVLSDSIPAANTENEQNNTSETLNKTKTVSEAIKEEAPVNMQPSVTAEPLTVEKNTEAVKTVGAEPVAKPALEPALVAETPAPAKEASVEPTPAPVNSVANTAVQEEKPVEAAAKGSAEVSEKGLAEGAEAVPAPYYFESSRGSTLAVIIVLLVFVSYYTFQAQRGREMFIRRISGLSAIEDAVGRATEMGRGVLYVPGIMDMDDIQTIAGVTIMGHVARKTAEYDTDFYAPMTRSFVMSVAQEVVKQAYMEKGRVDAYRPDRINYLTDDQFGYVAGVGGIMMRDKPAACFYLGTFYAESLILAETGNSIGAIQIAGTAEPSQIPFFVAACDYTLIGEELFAASAYLSKNPREVGSLKGQDMVKVVIILAIIIGTLLETIAATDYGQKIGFGTAATTFMEYLK